MMRNIALAILVAVLSVFGLFAVNLVVMQIGPDHYRTVVADAVRNGTMAATTRQPFGPRATSIWSVEATARS